MNEQRHDDEGVLGDLEPEAERAEAVRGGEDTGTGAGAATGTGTATEKPNPGKMNFEHYFDKSSPIVRP